MNIDIQIGLLCLLIGGICIWQGIDVKGKVDEVLAKGQRRRLFVIGGVLIIMALMLLLDVIDFKNSEI